MVSWQPCAAPCACPAAAQPAARHLRHHCCQVTLLQLLPPLLAAFRGFAAEYKRQGRPLHILVRALPALLWKLQLATAGSPKAVHASPCAGQQRGGIHLDEAHDARGCGGAVPGKHQAEAWAPPTPAHPAWQAPSVHASPRLQQPDPLPACRATPEAMHAATRVCVALPRQVNHLGPYLLTRLLEGLLVSSALSRCASS